MWLNQSATPLERPKELAGRQFLTDEEVAELKKRAARLFDSKTDSDFPGGRQFFHALLANPERFENPNATGNVSVMIERTIENRTSLIVDPPDGKIPPMTAEGQKRLARTPPPNAAGQAPVAGPEELSNAMRCITYGMPRLGVQNINAAGPMGYYQILQTPGHMTLTLEAIHETRIIPLDGRPHLPREYATVERGLAGTMGGEYAGRRHHEFLAAQQLHGGRRESPRRSSGLRASLLTCSSTKSQWTI